MGAIRLRTSLRNVTSLSYRLQRLRNFSSSSSTSPRKWKFLSDDPADGGSSVYRHALKSQRPSTIKWQEQLRNSVSFIGTVDRPVKNVNAVHGFGVYTLINVKASPKSNNFFKVLLKMWDEMADISIKHLKPNDCIYVSGHLGSYTKVDDNGKLHTAYEVIVKEINHVVQCGQGPTCKKANQSDSGEGETGLEKYKNRLHLWQVFFANPLEWWDNRRRKPNPNHPDFKHKDTGEALWIHSSDPPWVKKQLQLYDSSVAAQGLRQDVRSRSSLSMWVFND
ncbi:protein OSB1, mitochondrial-like [Actinidia eriantha]|uniref:protein OSB1, mitochondrial-like n=1 Tax=Actinidia eriantha TaxID=165200 RepID=UPI00258926EF|nr:protein OSB1, mitochondrial-like [Actinidia eriantha]